MKRIAAFLVLALVSAGISIRAQAPTDLPRAREVIDRFVAAIGGANAVRKYSARHLTGTFEVPKQGLSGALEVFAAAPNRLLVKVSVPGLGEIVQGSDGKIAWSINPMTGPMLLEGLMRDETMMDADFYAELHDPARFKSMEVIERTEFEGTPAYKLKLVRPSGQEDMEFYAVETGLLIGSVATRTSPMGPMQQTLVYADYKDFGGVRLSTRQVQRVMGVEQVITIKTVEHAPIDDATFAPPPQIKALVK